MSLAYAKRIITNQRPAHRAKTAFRPPESGTVQFSKESLGGRGNDSGVNVSRNLA